MTRAFNAKDVSIRPLHVRPPRGADHRGPPIGADVDDQPTTSGQSAFVVSVRTRGCLCATEPGRQGIDQITHGHRSLTCEELSCAIIGFITIRAEYVSHSAKDEAPPTPEDLKNDIASLKVVVESIRARRKDK